MLRLFFLIYTLVGATLAGSAVVAALVLGFDTSDMILATAAAGALLGVPFSWMVSARLVGHV